MAPAFGLYGPAAGASGGGSDSVDKKGVADVTVKAFVILVDHMIFFLWCAMRRNAFFLAESAQQLAKMVKPPGRKTSPSAAGQIADNSSKCTAFLFVHTLPRSMSSFTNEHHGWAWI